MGQEEAIPFVSLVATENRQNSLFVSVITFAFDASDGLTSPPGKVAVK